jgi:Nucleotidyl transferase AbiEii toxin, Type IV TA system
MRLHENKTLFRQTIQFTADRLGILAIYVEKDYWVTYALYTIFQNKIGEDTVFKGGTSLSKCYNLIERFSEDIDLVVLRRTGETDTKLNSKLKAIGKVVAAVLPEIDVSTITRKMGMNRKTAHTYPKIFKADYGQVRDFLVLEATWLGHFEPFTTKSICSFAGEMMLKNGQSEMAQKYELLPFEVRVLEPTRTLCEKIMSLVRFSYVSNPLADLKQKVRHIYDLHQLLRQVEFSDFLDSTSFETMLIKVAKDDVTSFKNNNAWLKNHPSIALIYNETEAVWKELLPVYKNEFSNLVHGELPKESDILQTLIRIKNRLKPVNWTVKV